MNHDVSLKLQVFTHKTSNFTQYYDSLVWVDAWVHYLYSLNFMSK